MIMNDLANDFLNILMHGTKKEWRSILPTGEKNGAIMIMNDPSSRWHLAPIGEKRGGSRAVALTGG